NYGCEVLVHDPYCDPEEACVEYDVNLTKDVSDLQPVSAIVVAVAHQPYKKWTMAQWSARLQAGGVVIDVKGIAPREELVQAGINIWRL
ncbi:MAG: UDP binding domain-containing protein, partial [Deltaproteobacteria bacterium]